MSKKEFIRTNRKEIDKVIKSICPNCKFNDDERENWISNEPGLYQWARRCGVNI